MDVWGERDAPSAVPPNTGGPSQWRPFPKRQLQDGPRRPLFTSRCHNVSRRRFAPYPFSRKLVDAVIHLAHQKEPAALLSGGGSPRLVARSACIDRVESGSLTRTTSKDENSVSRMIALTEPASPRPLVPAQDGRLEALRKSATRMFKDHFAGEILSPHPAAALPREPQLRLPLGIRCPAVIL